MMMIRATALLALLLLSSTAQAAKRPNIIVILADDLGFSDIGSYGSEIQTPHLDDLAARGTRFRNFYNTARCCPTRASWN
jgi:arylsulfatase A-like enzyme